MATPNQLSTSVKYKFGSDELDLKDYIRNLDHNYLSYVNSKNWNDVLKERFRLAYDNIRKGLLDLLDNNTTRFSTDYSGALIDLLGTLGNVDNDDIDPVGSEYYYDNAGNRITTDDYNLLNKKDLKNYTRFSADRQVATFLNKVGMALRDLRKDKASPSSNSAFNLSKHGFLANWERINNPAGETFSYDPYLEKDVIDESTGQRGTANRAAYLKELIENYINNIGLYDFSSTAFKDRDTYISKLQAAAQSLENGYDTLDVIALNLAGIGNDFLSKFFAAEAKEEKSELELEAEKAAKELKQREKDNALKDVIELRDEALYNDERDAFFNDYLSQNPFESTINLVAVPLSYSVANQSEAIAKGYGVDKDNLDAMTSAIRDFINFPLLARIIRGQEKKINSRGEDVTTAHIANNLDYAYKSNLFLDPKYLKDDGTSILLDGYYVIPGSENYDNWSFLAYNPITRRYQELSMLINDELKKRMAYNEYDRRKKTSKLENGGIIKHQYGGLAGGLQDWIKQNLEKTKKEADEKKRVADKAKESGKTIELVKALERKPLEEGFSTLDYIRLGTAAADAASAAAAFIPGYGTVASGGLGLLSTLVNTGADIADENVSGWGVARNALYGLGMDVVGLIPGWGTTGKAAKITKALKPLSKIIIGGLSAYGMYHSLGAFNKLMSNPSDMSVEDWQNLVTGLLALSGAARYKAGDKAFNRATTSRDVADVKTSTGKTVTISSENLDRLRKTKGLEEQNKLFSELTGGLELLREFKDREIKWTRPWKSRWFSDSPEVSQRTESSFLPEDNSKDAKFFRWVYRDPKNPTAPEPAKPAPKQSTPNFKKVRELSSKTDKLTEKEIDLINKQRKSQGKPALNLKEIDALNARRDNRKPSTPEKSVFEQKRELLQTKQAVNKARKELDLANARSNFRKSISNNQLRDFANIDMEVPRTNPLTGGLRASKQKMYDRMFGEVEKREFFNDARSKLADFYRARFPKTLLGKTDDEVFKLIDLLRVLSWRKQGGILSNIRKFDGGGRNTISSANWFSDMFNSSAMKSWLSTYNTDNYEDFNNLQKSWSANKKATGYTPGMERVTFNQGVRDRQLLWDKTGTNLTIWDLLKSGKIKQMGNSGDNSLGESYSGDGYFGEQEYLRHGGTKESWLGKEKELAEFQKQLAEKGLTYTLDEDSGMYLLGTLSNNDPDKVGEKPKTVRRIEVEKPEIEKSEVGSENGDSNDLSNLLSKLFFNNPTITYGLPRAAYADRLNRRMTDLAKASVVPLLKDPFEFHRYTRSDLDAEMQGERNYADLRRLASRPLTSDGSLQTATLLQAESLGLEARTSGKEKSNQTLRQYDELAWLQEKENASNRHENAMFNRALLWGADLDKSKFELAYLSKKHNIWDTFWLQLEYDARTKQLETKALTDSFVRSDIHNAVNYNPNEYGANLNASELAVWNKVLTGALVSSLSSEERNTYITAMRKVSSAEQSQLGSYYNIPRTIWSGKNTPPSTESWKASILAKSGGVLKSKNGSKIAIAGIEAKTADAERFLKQIKECIDRNEKTLDRLSKSLHGIIKSSIIK